MEKPFIYGELIMFGRCFLFFIFCFFTFAGWSFQLDWSGYFKSQVYYIQPIEEKNEKSSEEPEDQQSSQVDPRIVYSDYDLVLNAKARASDGILAVSKLSIFSEKSLNAQKGSSFPRRSVQGGEMESSLLEVTHFYGVYTGEHYKVDFGRQPFEFGLGMTHSAGDHYAEIVYDVRDAVSVEVRASDSIFFKPYIVFKKNNQLEGAFQGGYEREEFGGEILYSISSGNPQWNAYGYYNYDPFSLGIEWGALENSENSENSSDNSSDNSDKVFQSMAGVGELKWKAPFYSSEFKLIGGYITADNANTKEVDESYTLNANYNPTFMFWDFFHSSEEEKTYGLSGCTFLTLYGSIPFRDYFKFAVSDTVITRNPLKSLKNNFKGNEIVLSAIYDSKKGFIWENKLAFLWMVNGENRIGAVSRAVIQF